MQYFRQPKIYISLPSRGIYNKPGTLDTNIENMPVYSMTGMDEILLQTPDALMTGEGTVKVIESCCPTIKDAWELSNIDFDLILIAIRIATFGNMLPVTKKCSNCGEENQYDIDLSQIIDHYNDIKYNNKLDLNGITLNLAPLTYRQMTSVSIKNYQIQKQLALAGNIEDQEERTKIMTQLFEMIGNLKNEIYLNSIESIKTPEVLVTDKEYIREWLENTDKSVFAKIKSVLDANSAAIQTPPISVKCANCDAVNQVVVELDESSFFDHA